jgi:hypothetical protein
MKRNIRPVKQGLPPATMSVFPQPQHNPNDATINSTPNDATINPMTNNLNNTMMHPPQLTQLCLITLFGQPL